jgi:hypothetical protein
LGKTKQPNNQKGQMKLKYHSLAVIAAAALGALPPAASADVITDWNLIMVTASKTAGQNSNLGSRTDAIEAIAVYDAVNSIRQFGTKYHYFAPNTGSAQAAAAQAAHDVLVNYFPSQQAALNAALTNSLANITDVRLETAWQSARRQRRTSIQPSGRIRSGSTGR